MFRVPGNGFRRWRAQWENRKGQSLVEFAFVFPAFLLMVYAIIYFGFVFADYSTLNNIARSAARSASLQGSSKYRDIIDGELGALAPHGMPSEGWTDKEPLFLFQKGGKLASGATFDITETGDNVVVEIVAPMNPDAAIGKLFKTFDYQDRRWARLSVTYTMYNEAKGTSST